MSETDVTSWVVQTQTLAGSWWPEKGGDDVATSHPSSTASPLLPPQQRLFEHTQITPLCNLLHLPRLTLQLPKTCRSPFAPHSLTGTTGTRTRASHMRLRVSRTAPTHHVCTFAHHALHPRILHFTHPCSHNMGPTVHTTGRCIRSPNSFQHGPPR